MNLSTDDKPRQPNARRATASTRESAGAMSVVENSPGKYTGTVTAVVTGQVIGLATYNTPTLTTVILNEGVLYDGKLVEETAVA